MILLIVMVWINRDVDKKYGINNSKSDILFK